MLPLCDVEDWSAEIDQVATMYIIVPLLLVLANYFFSENAK